MGEPKRWYERFFAGLYADALASEPLETAAPADARLIRRVLHLRKGRRVLDCPSGLGRIALPLAKMGMQVTGADLTASYVRRAAARAKRAGLDIPFIQADMRELPFACEFDAVVNWFTSFGYFDEAGNLAAARAAYAALKPGGRLLVDVLNKTSLLPRFTPEGHEEAGGVRIVSRRRWDSRANRIRDCWTMTKGRRRERHRFSIRLYSGPELRAVLRQAGFADVRLYGALPLGPLKRSSRRIIAVATRPPAAATIELMHLRDYDEVLALWKASVGLGLHLDSSDSRRGIGLYLARNPRSCFVARDGRRIVGTILCGHEGRRGYLTHLAVAASHRRCGIGKALVNRALAALREAGIPRCNLFVMGPNAAGRAFWEALGWRDFAERGVLGLTRDTGLL